MTPEDLVSQLAPVRVPEEFARFGVQDALAVVALGLLGGVLLSLALRPLTRPGQRATDRAEAAIAALRSRDRQERVTGLALLLRDLGSDIPQTARPGLYDPGAETDPAALETAIRAAAQSARSRGR